MNLEYNRSIPAVLWRSDNLFIYILSSWKHVCEFMMNQNLTFSRAAPELLGNVEGMFIYAITMILSVDLNLLQHIGVLSGFMKPVAG